MSEGRLAVDSSLGHTRFQERMAALSVDDGLSQAMDAVSMTLDCLDLPSYKMDAIPRGFCVVINNKDFRNDDASTSDDDLTEERSGTDVDRRNLKATFKRLHFTVKVFENQTDAQIREIIKELSEEDHSRYDCFVCCVLTHGDCGVVYGINRKAVRVQELMNPFRPDRCPTLAGKPKLFFLQACRGDREDRGYVHSDLQTDVSRVENIRMIPNEADFLVSYSTVLGYVSWRSCLSGSWYIEQLTELLDKHAESHDIGEILRAVNWKVGQKTADILNKGTFKQAPVYMDGLMKKLVFKRKNDPQVRVLVMAFDPLTATPRRVFCVDTKQLAVKGDRDKPRIPSLVVTDGGLVVMADVCNRKVKVMDTRSPGPVSELSLKASPWGLTICHDGLIGVTSFSDCVIHLIDVTSQLRVVKKIKTARKYLGVGCGGADGTLVLSSNKKGNTPATVDLVSRKGQVIRTIVDGAALSGLCEPWYLYVRGGVVLVSDYDAQCVFSVELATGRVVATHRPFGLSRPLQVTVDTAGHIYVASGSSVLMMGDDGRWLRNLLCGGEHGEGDYMWPQCVAVTHTGVVVAWDNFGSPKSCVLTGFELR